MPHDQRLAVRDVVREMIVIAWAPGALYRLSFGFHDRLQDSICDLKSASGLRPTATEARVRAALGAWRDADERIEALSQLVPTRFLSPWLELGLDPSIRDDRRTRAIVRKAAETLADPDGPPYALERTGGELVIDFGPGWREWFLGHSLILARHTEFALARFLQSRNPHVPGIVDKLKMPGNRKLAPARRMIERLRHKQGRLVDAYSGNMLDLRYAVDHVLPRSFVAHDLLWNLVPTSVDHNQDKGETLPGRSLLPKIAQFHHEAIAASPVGAPEIDDYLAVFGISETELRALGGAEFEQAYTKLLSPLLEIASAQGFSTEWQPKTSVTRIIV